MISSLETARLRDAVHELGARIPQTEAELEKTQHEYETLRARIAALRAAEARTAGNADGDRSATSQRRLLETDVRYQSMATTQLQRDRCAADRDLTLAARALVAVKGQLSEAMAENRAVRRQLDARETEVLRRIRGGDIRTRIRALCWLVGRLERGAE